MTLIDDIKWATRIARRRPLFTLTVAATLAVSIAAATTTYGLATAVLWRPLPFPDEGRLVFVWETQEIDGQRRPARVTSGRAVEWRNGTQSLSSMAVFAAAGLTAEDPDGAVSLRGMRVAANYFDVLALRPILGRAFMPEDERPGAPPVIILSHALWQERFGGEPGAVGSSVRLSGAAYTIVGVMPPVVTPAWPANPAIVSIDAQSREFWIPIARTPQFDQQMRAHVYGVVARLAPGVTRDQAAAELTGLVSTDAADRHGAQVTPLRDQFVRDARLPLLAVAGAALAVLLIACANLAALQATAIEARRAELAVRAAIGAGRSRLVQQLGVESLMMAAAGGLGGVALTRVALNEVPSRLPPSVPLLTIPSLDWRVIVFALAITTLAGLALAAWPILQLARAPASRGVAGGGRRFVFRGLVAAQVAVTAALAVAAALLTQSLVTVRGGDPGFVIDNVLVTSVGLPSTVVRDPSAIAGIEARMLQTITARPGVIGAALAYDHPLQANWSDAITIIGDTAAAVSDADSQAELRIVSPGYFDALGVEVLDGRAFGPRDDLSAPGAVMVNEALARTLSPGLVLGRRLRSSAASFTWGDRAPRVYTIVGIVENERFRGLEQPVQPALYVSTLQFPQQATELLVRTAGDPLALAADVRAIVRSIEPGATMAAPRSLAGILRDQLVTRRATTDVFGGFAAAALVLAALGLYGLTAGVVSSRTREIGVRLALGASPGAVARLVVDDSLITAGAGVAVGLVLALWAGRLIESLLVGVGSRDPVTLAVVAATLLIVAALAAVLPARRAASVDPATVLRGE
jgi:putative ABC transport system permease protein